MSAVVQFLISSLLFITVVSPALAAPGKQKTTPAPTKASDPTCKAAILIEPSTGVVLFEENADQPLAPASMVKMMTSYVVLKRVKEGGIKLSDPVTVSAGASKIGGSQVYLKAGEQFALSELLEALMIQSANDAALAIAEYVGGSRDGFVEMMNREAGALDLTQSKFYSPHGLPPSKDQLPDLMSARDLAKLSQVLVRDYPELLQWTGKQEGDFRNGEFKLRTHNHLIGRFSGCDGLKTGFYNEAGFGVTATATRNGVRLVSVLMGCDGRKLRDDRAAELLSRGFAEVRPTKLTDKGQVAGAPVRVVGGATGQTTPVTTEAISVPLRSGEEAQITRKVEACAELKAPVAANTPCGSVKFLLGDREVARTTLVVSEGIEKGGIASMVRGALGF